MPIFPLNINQPTKLAAMDRECNYRLLPHQLPLQKNAFRVEIFPPAPRCALKPKRDNAGRLHDVWRWVNSGGDPITVARPCSGRCPLRVYASIRCAQMWYERDIYRGYCPLCGQGVHRYDTPGAVTCPQCKTNFELIRR